MLAKLLQQNRSIRRFIQNDRIPVEALLRWVGNCRYCASGRNAQALKYVVVHQEEECAKVFPLLTWAGYLKDWPGPEEGERPSAYLIQLLDKDIAANCLCDDGIQLQTLGLSACAEGYGGCIIKAFRNQPLRELLALPEYLKINYVLALGVPAETVFLEPMRGDDCKYWRDAQGIHHVPKRSLEELLIP